MKADQVIVLLLGAEGVSELRDAPWAREASESEVELLKLHIKERRELPTDPYYEDLLIDGIGRPYWAIAIEPTAPEWAREIAGRKIRALRLE